jgi:hypothetical protein
VCRMGAAVGLRPLRCLNLRAVGVPSRIRKRRRRHGYRSRSVADARLRKGLTRRARGTYCQAKMTSSSSQGRHQFARSSLLWNRRLVKVRASQRDQQRLYRWSGPSSASHGTC